MQYLHYAPRSEDAAAGRRGVPRQGPGGPDIFGHLWTSWDDFVALRVNLGAYAGSSVQRTVRAGPTRPSRPGTSWGILGSARQCVECVAGDGAAIRVGVRDDVGARKRPKHGANQRGRASVQAAPTTVAHRDDSRLRVRPRRCLIATPDRATQRWEIDPRADGFPAATSPMRERQLAGAPPARSRVCPLASDQNSMSSPDRSPNRLPVKAGPVPDKLTIWPVDDGRYGLDATFRAHRATSVPSTINRSCSDAESPIPSARNSAADGRSASDLSAPSTWRPLCQRSSTEPPTKQSRGIYRGCRRRTALGPCEPPGVADDAFLRMDAASLRRRATPFVANHASRVEPAHACFRDCIGAAWRPLTVAPCSAGGERCVCGAASPGHPREGGQAPDHSAAADALPLEAALLQLDTDFELHRLSHGPAMQRSRALRRDECSSSRLFLKRFAAGPSCSLVGASLVTCPW